MKKLYSFETYILNISSKLIFFRLFFEFPYNNNIINSVSINERNMNFFNIIFSKFFEFKKIAINYIYYKLYDCFKFKNIKSNNYYYKNLTNFFYFINESISIIVKSFLFFIIYGFFRILKIIFLFVKKLEKKRNINSQMKWNSKKIDFIEKEKSKKD